MRLVFMGTPEFSVPILQALIDDGHEIVAVYTQPPRPAGRGKKLRPSPVQILAEAEGLSVRSPVSLKTPEALADFSALKADVAVVVAYGLILPQSILDAPVQGCLNIHASLLPRWRGAAPIHRAILAGDEVTGICIMQMEAGLDTGPVRYRVETPIEATATTAVLHDRLSALGAASITKVLSNLGAYPPEKQLEAGVTYAEKIDKSEARVDWTESAVNVDRKIRGLSPFPGAWTTLDGERIKLLTSRLTSGSGTAGTVIDGLNIACGQGAVEVTRLQRAGKSAQSAEEFLRGTPMAPGTTLGE